MLMNTLSDAELRRLVDTEPENQAAVQEVVRRFIDADGGVDSLEAEIEELEDAKASLENKIEELEDRIAELEDA